MDDQERDDFVWDTMAMFWSEGVRELVQALPEDELHFLFVILRSFIYEAAEVGALQEGVETEARGDFHIFLYMAVEALLEDEFHQEDWSDELMALEEYLDQEARFFCMMRGE
jgi:hypothetical protein